VDIGSDFDKVTDGEIDWIFAQFVLLGDASFFKIFLKI